MKNIKMLIVSLLALGSLAAPAWATTEMECYATHGDSEASFYGSGFKWVAAHKAISACVEWAEENGLDKNECKIVECNPVLPTDY